MPMNETHMRELMELERQKLAIQFAAIEVAIDDKIQLQTKKIVDVMSRTIAGAVTELKEDNVRRDLALRNELGAMKGELKADIARLEEKLDNHIH